MRSGERARFEAWLAADERHRAAYARAACLWREVGGLDKASLPPAARRPLPRERVIARYRDGRWRHPLHGAGGAVVVAALVLVLLNVIPFGHPDADVMETAAAEIREVTLGDGSIVTLGARTSLSVTLDARARAIELRAGEAFFDVASDPDRAFSVRVGTMRIEAVGTAFDVRRIGDGFQVAVAEGLVALRGLTAAGESSARLRAGQRVSVSGAGKRGRITAVNPAKLGAWRRGRLVYVGAPLSEVVADANRYHDGWILLRDRRAANLEITAVFDANDIGLMLATLDDALPITVWRPMDAIAVIGSAAPGASD